PTTPERGSEPYSVGRGVGGSSAVNGLLAQIDPTDPALGGVSVAAEVEAALGRVAVPRALTPVEELGDLDQALHAAGVADLVPLHRAGGRRADLAGALLGDHPTLEIRTGCVVDRVESRGSSGATVVTAAGERLTASAAVCCAGAFGSPAILQRSGLGRHVGDHLQDHPSVALDLRLGVRRRVSDLPTATTVRAGPIEVVPLGHTGAPVAPDAALLVALMEPTGAHGSVRIVSDDPADPPVARFESFAEREDLDALAVGVRAAGDLLHHPEVRALLGDEVRAMAGDRPLDDRDDDELRSWIRTTPGAHRHASASCGIGRTLDADGRVIGTDAVFVADASAFPRIPRTGTHLPTLVQAERLVWRWLHGMMRR
ncbi:MAG: GMC oxidoreductase, partial [Actinomycetota bacterium]